MAGKRRRERQRKAAYTRHRKLSTLLRGQHDRRALESPTPENGRSEASNWIPVTWDRRADRPRLPTRPRACSCCCIGRSGRCWF